MVLGFFNSISCNWFSFVKLINYQCVLSILLSVGTLTESKTDKPAWNMLWIGDRSSLIGWMSGFDMVEFGAISYLVVFDAEFKFDKWGLKIINSSFYPFWFPFPAKRIHKRHNWIKYFLFLIPLKTAVYVYYIPLS